MEFQENLKIKKISAAFKYMIRNSNLQLHGNQMISLLLLQYFEIFAFYFLARKDKFLLLTFHQ